jgi:hypothetical protein
MALVLFAGFARRPPLKSHFDPQLSYLRRAAGKLGFQNLSFGNLTETPRLDECHSSLRSVTWMSSTPIRWRNMCDDVEAVSKPCTMAFQGRRIWKSSGNDGLGRPSYGKTSVSKCALSTHCLLASVEKNEVKPHEI